MGMGTGEKEEEGAGGGRRGQEEDQAMRIIERLWKLKEGAEERQQSYNTMEQYFEELGKNQLTNDEIQRSFANAISDLAGGIQELYGVVNILTQMVTEESIRRQQQQQL